MKNKTVVVDLSRVNWKLLRKQKKSFLETIAASILTSHNPKRILDLDGILNLLDHIQDEAAKQIGEKAVFGD